MKTEKTLYTVQKVKNKKNECFKRSHGSTDGEISVCGIKFNHNWFITNNTFDGEITCQKCLKEMKNKYYQLR